MWVDEATTVSIVACCGCSLSTFSTSSYFDVSVVYVFINPLMSINKTCALAVISLSYSEQDIYSILCMYCASLRPPPSKSVNYLGTFLVFWSITRFYTTDYCC